MGIFQFLKETRIELAKVVWPTKSETLKYTLTVVGFSIVMAVILGLFDLGLLNLTGKILVR